MVHQLSKAGKVFEAFWKQSGLLLGCWCLSKIKGSIRFSSCRFTEKGVEKKKQTRDADWFCLTLHSDSLSSIVSQNKEPDLGQKYLGKTLNSSRSQQKKKVRWTPNTVEPSGDNQDYRRRPRTTIHSVCTHSPIQRPVTSYACERPRLQSQAAKNTITGTHQTVHKNQYNYLWWQKNPICDLRSWCVFLGCLFAWSARDVPFLL